MECHQILVKLYTSGELICSEKLTDERGFRHKWGPCARAVGGDILRSARITPGNAHDDSGVH